MTTAQKPAVAGLNVRCMIRRDMAEVHNIEDACWDEPWSDAQFLFCLRDRNTIGKVAEAEVDGDCRVLGFCIYQLKPRSFEILNLAVDPRKWRRGVGTEILNSIKDSSVFKRRGKMAAYVNERLVGAQLFLRAYGFLATRVERGFYADSGDDGYRMEYRVQ